MFSRAPTNRCRHVCLSRADQNELIDVLLSHQTPRNLSVRFLPCSTWKSSSSARHVFSTCLSTKREKISLHHHRCEMLGIFDCISLRGGFSIKIYSVSSAALYRWDSDKVFLPCDNVMFAFIVLCIALRMVDEKLENFDFLSDSHSAIWYDERKKVWIQNIIDSNRERVKKKSEKRKQLKWREKSLAQSELRKKIEIEEMRNEKWATAGSWELEWVGRET